MVIVFIFPLFFCHRKKSVAFALVNDLFCFMAASVTGVDADSAGDDLCSEARLDQCCLGHVFRYAAASGVDFKIPWSGFLSGWKGSTGLICRLSLNAETN